MSTYDLQIPHFTSVRATFEEPGRAYELGSEADDRSISDIPAMPCHDVLITTAAGCILQALDSGCDSTWSVHVVTMGPKRVASPSQPNRGVKIL